MALRCHAWHGRCMKLNIADMFSTIDPFLDRLSFEIFDFAFHPPHAISHKMLHRPISDSAALFLACYLILF